MSKGLGKTVLVTGASGMIGRAVVKHLCSQGYTVKAQVRDRAKFAAITSDELLADAVRY